MSLFFSTLRPALHLLPPESAHRLGIRALSHGLVPAALLPHSAVLSTELLGLRFPSPIGLAAGFDKNAEAVDGLLRLGFGFVEAGTVTPLAQPGNPKPRLFRLGRQEAVINRLGFNNEGLPPFVARLKTRRRALGIAGANIGRNKDTADAVSDYVTGLEAVYPHADYVTVNISSPNTQGLRDLQHGSALDELLSALAQTRAGCEALGRRVPLLLKVAPDLDEAQSHTIMDCVLRHGIDGLIVSNTTLARPPELTGPHRGETGGLSGKPLFAPSTEVLERFYRLAQGRLPLIGVGGIASAEDAYAKIRAGASLVQFYTALVYQGFGLVREMTEGLERLLVRDGFSRVADAVGAGR